jgi:hypothetical protein
LRSPLNGINVDDMGFRRSESEERGGSWRRPENRSALLVIGVPMLLALFVDMSAAKAAITLTFEQTVVGRDTALTRQIFEGSRLRVDSSVGGRLRRFTVYDHGTKTLLVVDLESQRYRELTGKDVVELEKGGITAPRRVTYEKVGSGKTIAGYACDVYRVFADTRLRNQGCFAPWSPRLITKAEVEDMATLMEGLQRFQSTRGERWGTGPGLPVEQHFSNPDGKTVRLTSVLRSVSRAHVPASTFQVPSGPGWSKVSP